MILVEITVERLNETYIEHKLLDTKEHIKEIKEELEATKKMLYSDTYFVGYYSYLVSELDIDSVLVSDLRLTIQDFKKLMSYVTGNN